MNQDQWEYVKHFVLDEWIEDESKRQFTWAVHKFVTGYLGQSQSVDKEHAVTKYLNALRQFCELHQMTLEECILEAHNDKKQEHPKDITYIAEARLAQFRDHLTSKGTLKPNVVRLYCIYIQSIYSYNDIRISSKHCKLPQQRKSHIPRLTKEQVLAVYNNAESLRDRAIIHLLWSTGLRIGDALALNRKDYQEFDDWGIISITSQKRDRFLITTLTPDALESVKRYLNRRDDQHEALFSMRRKSGGWKRVDYNYVRKMFHNLRNELGIEGLHAHNFRRAFVRNLELAGMREDIRKFMTGHARGVDGESYVRGYYEEEVLKAIKPHYHILRLTGVTEETEVMLESVESLKTEVARLKSTVKKLVDSHPDFQGWEPYDEGDIKD